MTRGDKELMVKIVLAVTAIITTGLAVFLAVVWVFSNAALMNTPIGGH